MGAIWIGAIIGAVLGFSIQVAILVYLVKIWGVLNEAISCGIVPGLLEGRAKERAIKILRIGWIHDRQEAERVCHTLSTMKNGKENNSLYVQLSGLLDKKE